MVKRVAMFKGAVSIMIAAVVILSLFVTSCSPKRGLGNAKKDLQSNLELFVITRDFLVEEEYDYISIRFRGEGTMFVNKTDTPYVPIDNDEVIEALDLLRQRGFEHTLKYKDSVQFYRRSHSEIYYGIVYSMDGQAPDDTVVQFLTKIEPLTEEGWYYFEGDYNRYRVLDISG